MKKITYLMVFLVLIASANAFTWTDGAEDNTTDAWNVTDAITTQSYNVYTGTNGFTTQGGNGVFAARTQIGTSPLTATVSHRFKMIDGSGGDISPKYGDDTATACGVELFIEGSGDGNQRRISYYNGGSLTSTGKTWASGQWYNLNVTYNQNTKQWNGSIDFINGSTLWSATNIAYRGLGGACSATDYFGIYKAGTDNGYYFADDWRVSNETPAAGNSNIQATEYDSSATISTFNATIENASISWAYTTADGILETNISSGTYNITIASENYFTNVSLNIDLSSNYASKLYQSNISFSSRHAVTGATLTGVTYTSENAQASTSRLYLAAGNQNVTASKTGYYTNTENFTITALENSSKEINLSDYLLNITAYNYTGAAINTFTVTINYLNGSYTKNYSTTNGYIEALVLNGTWNVTLDADGYAIYSKTQIISANYTEMNFSDVYTTNSVNITFYDEDTLNLLDSITITADFISDAYANNYTTTTGILFEDLLSPADYQIIYSGSGGYDERSYFFTLTNRSTTEISLYLTNGSTQITVTLYDQFNNLLEGYEIQLLKYYVASNSFIAVGEGMTNFEGVTKLYATLNDPYYKFRIYDTDGELLKTTGSTQLYDTSINLFVELGTTVGELLDKLETVTYNLDFLTSSDQFRLIFTNIDGANVDAKIDVYTVTPAAETLNTTSTTTAASGTLYASVTPENGTVYKAYAYIKYGGDTDFTLVDVMTYSYTGIVNTFGLYGLLLSLIIVVAFIMIGVSNPTLSAVLVPISLILTRVAGLHVLEWSIITGITAVAVIIIYLISDRT